MKNFAKAFGAVSCACVLAAAAPANAGAKVTVGISDNASAMFTSSLFNTLNITTTRLVVDWNVAVERN